MLGWRRREGGAVVTWELPNGAEVVPMLPVAQRQAFDLGELKFRAINAEAEAQFGIPDGWLAAMEYRESGFNARAFRVERRKDGTPIIDKSGRPLTGVGAMQITSGALKGRLTDEQLFEPRLNVMIGAKYLADLIKRYGFDFPRCAAAYNAGSARTPLPGHENPWGLHQTAGHVSTEVSALNYYLERQKTIREHELVELLDVAVRQEFDLAPTVDWMGRQPSADPLDEPAAPSGDTPTRPDVAALPRKRES